MNTIFVELFAKRVVVSPGRHLNDARYFPLYEEN